MFHYSLNKKKKKKKKKKNTKPPTQFQDQIDQNKYSFLKCLNDVFIMQLTGIEDEVK